MRAFKIFFVLVLSILFLNSYAAAQKTPQYMGVAKCKLCHNAPAYGGQFKIWQEGPHAKAFETLGSPEAKEMAVKAGVTGDPQKAGECLQCHQTAYGVKPELVDKGFKPGGGVECESCHGPGSLYRVVAVMNRAKFNANPEAVLAQWKELGLRQPDEKVCVQCHNEKSPAFKGFNFKEYRAKIEHPNPKNPLKKK